MVIYLFVVALTVFVVGFTFGYHTRRVAQIKELDVMLEDHNAAIERLVQENHILEMTVDLLQKQGVVEDMIRKAKAEATRRAEPLRKQ